jgi:hypothetical protein
MIYNYYTKERKFIKYNLKQMNDKIDFHFLLLILQRIDLYHPLQFTNTFKKSKLNFGIKK